jgi:hypothetical protein
MADVVVTATEVLADSGTITGDYTLGAAVTAGQVVYADSSDGGAVKPADADASLAAATAVGIALNGGADAQPCKVAIGGTLDPGFTVTVGTIYVVSDTAGGIMPAADLETGDYVGVLGVGITASQLKLFGTLGLSGVAVP